jgi:hypothetical protein
MSMVYFNDYFWSQGGVAAWSDPGQAREQNPFYRKRWLVAASFFYLWATVGFFTGTGVLVGPAGWVTSAMQRAGFGQKAQDHAMQAVILAFVLGSAFIALWLLRQALQGSRATRLAIPAACTVAALASLTAWMNPGKMLAAAAGGADARALSTASGARFIFGAYPDEATLRSLKEQGVTAVISLQHPAVVPFEPASIREEQRAAREVGVRFIHAPMLPWVSDNAASLEQIRRIAHEGRGVYYVHCGLGRDRTNVVRRMLEADGVKTMAHRSITKATTLDDRVKLQPGRGRAFERGDVRAMEPGVWLVPFPNPAELSGYMKAGQVKTVAFLLDPNDAGQRAWLGQARLDLATAGVTTVQRPLIGRDMPAAREIVAWVRTLPRPVVVVAAHTPYANGDRYPGTEAAGAFMDAYAQLAPAPAPAAVPSAAGKKTAARAGGR